MGIPVKKFTITAVALSLLAVTTSPDRLIFSNPTYLGTFFQLWISHFVVFAVWNVVLYPKYFSPLRHLPGPEGNSWWNGQWAKIKAEPSGQPQREWLNTIPNEGLIRYLGMFNAERLLITSPKGLGEVLTTKSYEFIKPATVRGIGRILGVGILLAEGEEHKIQRKNLLPAFAFRHIKNLYPMFWAKSRECVIAMTETIKAEAMTREKSGDIEKTPSDLAVLEVGAWASRVALDVIGVAGMGRDFGSIKDPNTEICETYLKVFQPSQEAQILGLLGFFLPLWIVRRIPVKRNGELEGAATAIRSICHGLVQEKKAKMEKGILEDKDILSVALESGAFTDDNLVDQVMTFMGAGHETTATAMTWGIYMLCLNPDVQTRLRAEIRAQLPSPDTDTEVTSEILDNMPYLSAVCNEVLRYYPPVPLTLREAAHSTTILYQRVPKNTKVILVPWATNRDHYYWGDDADRFNPDRWLPQGKGTEGKEDTEDREATEKKADREKRIGNGGAESNYNYMTFLHGPRACIGQGFAKAEFAALLAAWVGRFEFELRDEVLRDERKVEIKGGVTARPSQGMWVRTKVVEGW